jgi:pimeloyl-ACP methyl ester carboxylesterase
MRQFVPLACAVALVVATGCGRQPASEPEAVPSPQLANGSFSLDVDGVAIHYEVHGAGPALMALPNSWGLSLQGLRNLYRPLEHHLTMVYFDPRGMGASGAVRDDADMSMATVRSDLDALRRHLGLDRVNVIGWSNGATNLTLLASEQPEPIAHAIFLHTAASFTEDDGRALQESHPEMVESSVRFRKQLSEPGLSPERADELTRQYAIEGWAPVLCADAAGAPAMLHALFDDAEFSWAHSQYASRELPLYDFRDKLGSITAESLVIAGRHDLLPVERAADMVAAMPTARLVVLDNSGHFGPAEQTGEFVAAVTAFLAP